MGRYVSVVLAASLLVQGLCVPASVVRPRRQSSDISDNSIAESSNSVSSSTVNYDLPPPIPYNHDDDEDDDDLDIPTKYPSDGGGGSNVFSLLRLVTGLFPGSSSSSSKIYQRIIQEIMKRTKSRIIIKKSNVADNEIDIDFIAGLKPPPFQRQEENGKESSESESKNDSNESDNGKEESLEIEEERNGSEQNSDSNSDDDDYDEPPGGGDGEGGGLLGLLAGLSGGEDGQSDLGSLLATVGGIVANLSGDGIDLNALIASGLGLFVGLLSEGEENPGAIIASYLLTSLDTITGGGAKNNGAFFGKFLSKLIKGTSASSGTEKSSGEPAPSPLWTLKLDILRALLQFGTSILGVASSAVFSSSSG